MQILKEKYKPLYKDLNLIPDLPKDITKGYSNYSLKETFYFAKIVKK